MNSDLNGVAICGLGHVAAEMIRISLEKRLSACPMIVFLEAPEPPQLSQETILELTRQMEPATPFFPKESARERSRPNEPFYRALPRYRQRR